MPIQKWSDRIWILQLVDEPVLSEDLTTIKLEVEDAGEHPDLVIDFSQIANINSSNVSQLLRLRKQAIDHETKMKLVAMADSIWVVFMTTGLDKIFDFTADVSTALAALQLDNS